jgi:hypothetical protein
MSGTDHDEAMVQAHASQALSQSEIEALRLATLT